MAETNSLADRAVQALAGVSEMANGLGMYHPERHQVRRLKGIAEQILSSAFHAATDLVFQAEDLRRMAREMEQANHPTTDAPQPLPLPDLEGQPSDQTGLN